MLRQENFVTSGQPAVTLLSALLVFLPAPTLANDSLQPEGWDDRIRLTEPTDTNPDPEIVEIALEAGVAMVEIAPGVSVEAWTYNGTIPGPLIRVQVGDRLIVHYTNNLPRASTVHWHGLRVPIEMDGVPGTRSPRSSLASRLPMTSSSPMPASTGITLM